MGEDHGAIQLKFNVQDIVRSIPFLILPLAFIAAIVLGAVTRSALPPFAYMSAVYVWLLISGLRNSNDRPASAHERETWWRWLMQSHVLPRAYQPNLDSLTEMAIQLRHAKGRFEVMAGGCGLLGWLVSLAICFATGGTVLNSHVELSAILFGPVLVGIVVGITCAQYMQPAQNAAVKQGILSALQACLPPQFRHRIVALGLLASDAVAVLLLIPIVIVVNLGWSPSTPVAHDAADATVFAAYPWLVWVAPISVVLLIACRIAMMGRIRLLPEFRGPTALAYAASIQWRAIWFNVFGVVSAGILVLALPLTGYLLFVGKSPFLIISMFLAVLVWIGIIISPTLWWFSLMLHNSSTARKANWWS